MKTPNRPEPQSPTRWARSFWNISGTLFVLLGMIGVPLPVLPTTPFLLLATACYLRGSPRMHRWMLANKFFGEYLANYRAGRGIPVRTKLAAVTLLWLGIISSAVFAVENLVVRVLLLLIGAAVTVHIVRIKGSKPPQVCASGEIDD